MHRSIADDFTDALAEHVEALVVGDPTRRGDRRLGADLHAASATGSKSWIDEAVAGGAKIVDRRRASATTACCVPTVLTDVTPDMKVCAGEVFGPVVAIAAYDDLDEALRWPTTPTTGCRRRSSPATSARALKAVRTLDFGGVLVNEVPTWRADQQPYGGLRDSGNTREGPAYSVKEMTEIRMVVISG